MNGTLELDIERAVSVLSTSATTDLPCTIRNCACEVHELVTGMGKYVNPSSRQWIFRQECTVLPEILISRLYELRTRWAWFVLFKLPQNLIEDPHITDHCMYLGHYLDEVIRYLQKKSLKQGKNTN
jgi:hypothetical protein